MDHILVLFNAKTFIFIFEMTTNPVRKVGAYVKNMDQLDGYYCFLLLVIPEEDPMWPYILAGSLVVVLLVAILVGFLLWQRYE